MACPVLLDPACVVVNTVVGAVANTAANDALSGIAGAIQDGVSWIVTNSVTWWVQLPSPDLTSEPAVSKLQQWTLPIAIAVAVGGLIIAGTRMAVTRKANPLIDVGGGLFTIAATSAVGVLLPALLLKAGDAWSTWILDASTGGQFASRLTSVLTLKGAAPAVVVILGIVAIVISATQAVLMLFRQGALIVLAGMLPLAAAGTLNPATRPWLRRVAGWELALIFYKPSAAAVYATAFTLIGTGKTIQAILTGFAMVLMSLLALPVLMRFFTWTAGQVADSAGGGGFLQTALAGAVAVGALRGSAGGSGAAEQARQVSAQLGPAGGQAFAGFPQTAPQSSGSGFGTPSGATAASPGAGAAPHTAAAGASGAATGGPAGAGAAGASSAAPAAGGPAGAAAAGLAGGAQSAGRKATEAMQPPHDTGGRS